MVTGHYFETIQKELDFKYQNLKSNNQADETGMEKRAARAEREEELKRRRKIETNKAGKEHEVKQVPP